MAAMMPGTRTMWYTPSAAITTNHSTMIGPNSLPTSAVPWRWIQNSAIRITIVIGSTRWDRCGVAISRPSTADITEIAGVITASP